MTDFDDRKNAFETKFARDEELKFKVEARRTKLMGSWAAGVMGLGPEEAKEYAQNLVLVDLQEAGTGDVIRKLTADFSAKGIDAASYKLDDKLAEFLEVAKEQLMEG